MFIPFLYEILLWLLAILALPQLIYAWIVQKKYRKSFSKRMGREFPSIDKGERTLIWIHAISVGEVKSVAVLAKRLKKEFPRSLLLITSITETGHAEAKRSIPEADYHLFLPYDFYWIITPIVNKVQPDIVVLCETDFWYHFLRACKNNGAYIVLVNGKISQTSAERFKWFSFFSNRLFSFFDVFALQSKLYAERFESLGISKDNIVVTGNLKFDSKPSLMSDDEKLAFRNRLGIKNDDQLIVVGSTHHLEEMMVLNAMEELLANKSDFKVVVVPRHPERFDEVASFIQAKYGFCCRYSVPEGDRGPIILLDTMGLLGKCYQIATVAIVAGSFTSAVGGHNILEPLWFGVPTIYGPYMFGQPDLVEAVSAYQAALQMPVESLGAKLKTLLKSENEMNKLRDASLRLIEAMQGSTERTLQVFSKYWN